MIDAATLEAIWLALGRQERQIHETMQTLKARGKQLRADGHQEAADQVADAVVALGLRMKQVNVALSQVEPLYFAALRAGRRKRSEN
ncbi:hypothetical protein [Hyphomicrobium sp. LHD-15]|uniref:hypothetical protein n=1 Tax=Hyphomicrobium sp. LHD-15 TaxID=3072142 RepID=UPI00280D8B09|nr:hypothetical protein [Hyphomicrobium sp. LHD-15]MDQ8699256.1 hypothetical protein [Hyphomicrobium sp. LHD-15]